MQQRVHKAGLLVQYLSFHKDQLNTYVYVTCVCGAAVHHQVIVISSVYKWGACEDTLLFVQLVRCVHEAAHYT